MSKTFSSTFCSPTPLLSGHTEITLRTISPKARSIIALVPVFFLSLPVFLIAAMVALIYQFEDYQLGILSIASVGILYLLYHFFKQGSDYYIRLNNKSILLSTQWTREYRWEEIDAWWCVMRPSLEEKKSVSRRMLWLSITLLLPKSDDDYYWSVDDSTSPSQVSCFIIRTSTKKIVNIPFLLLKAPNNTSILYSFFNQHCPVKQSNFSTAPLWSRLKTRILFELE
jgi:hypothetical protein